MQQAGTRSFRGHVETNLMLACSPFGSGRGNATSNLPGFRGMDESPRSELSPLKSEAA